MTSKEFVRDLAITLSAAGNKITGWDLAQRLNAAGLKTSYGSPYSGGRGVYTLVHATYNWLRNNGYPKIADIVAASYLNQDGDYAYD